MKYFKHLDWLREPVWLAGRLREIATMLDDTKSENFSLSDWILVHGEVTYGEQGMVRCGTVACALGWTALRLPQVGLYMRGSVLATGCPTYLPRKVARWIGLKPGLPHPRDLVHWGAVVVALGAHGADAGRLFSGWSETYFDDDLGHKYAEITPAIVAGHVRLAAEELDQLVVDGIETGSVWRET